MRKKLNVLIACEESQAECNAFRALGHRAFSCDLQPARKGTPLSTHIIADCRTIWNCPATFMTEDNKRHRVAQWDLIICHPPCTYLCKVSSVHMVINGILDKTRFKKMLEARDFFFECLNAPAKYVAVENPLFMARAELPPPTTYIQPFWFGVKYSKKTLYWLKNLPPIMPTKLNPNYKCFVTASRGKYRSRTFPEVAAAIAQQWSAYILADLQK